jgi:hypothetical protein
LTARKTLHVHISQSHLWAWTRLPQSISPHVFHKLLRTRLRDPLGRDTNTSVREEDIKTAVLFQRFVDYAFHIRLLAGIDFAGMDVDVWVEGIQLPFVRLQMLRVKVTDEDCFGSVVRELMYCSATNAERRIGSGNNDDFALYSAT